MTTVTAHSLFFGTSIFLLPLPWGTITRHFCLKKVSLYSETKGKHVFPCLALSVTCTNTVFISWLLSSGSWNVSAWLFAQQSYSSYWFSQGYCPEPVETSCIFHCMCVLTFLPSAWDVKRDTASTPRSHTCATASKLLVPYLDSF